ncbi:ACC oxidase 1 [Actinidia rufa]|uniref:aminocyclopropanecarboxylate oxidase n=1 Tax=Actinidia rufa TaxID=165716 RepID=A0A7J0FD43_9ERIC|nr:ACC oxidase 1 [Actinidia rufa]
MEVPVIDFGELDGQRSETMALLHRACEKWGCLQIENHGIDKSLMENVKQLVNQHDEENMKDSFYESEIANGLQNKSLTSDADWESTFFIWHRPKSNIDELTNLSDELRKVMDAYIDKLIKLEENLSELMCENLGIEKDYIKESFSGSKGPSVGTKVAKYPQCPRPELVRGLREHTDAGGIILLLQDDQVPGLEFFKDGQWVDIPPSKNNTVFVNTGDQMEVLTNRRYKSALQRVMADKNGSRLSIATFYNPVADAIISPAPKLLYPNRFRSQDYLNLDAMTKFAEKGPKFESMKRMVNGQHNNVV